MRRTLIALVLVGLAAADDFATRCTMVVGNDDAEGVGEGEEDLRVGRVDLRGRVELDEGARAIAEANGVTDPAALEAIEKATEAAMKTKPGAQQP